MIKQTLVYAWFGAGGEAYLQGLRVMKRRYVYWCILGSMPKNAPKLGIQRGRKHPLVKMALKEEMEHFVRTTHSLRATGII